MKGLHQPVLLSAISRPDRKPWRLLVLFAVILALLGVATASASPAHFHPKTATGCDICLTASLTAGAEVAEIQVLAVPQQRGMLEAPAASSFYSLLRYHATHTRGPPAHSL